VSPGASPGRRVLREGPPPALGRRRGDDPPSWLQERRPLLLTSLTAPHCQTRRVEPDTTTPAPSVRRTSLGNRRAKGYAMVTITVLPGPTDAGHQGGARHAMCRLRGLLGQAEGRGSQPVRGKPRTRHVSTARLTRASRGPLAAVRAGKPRACHASFKRPARASPEYATCPRAATRGAGGYATCPHAPYRGSPRLRHVPTRALPGGARGYATCTDGPLATNFPRAHLSATPA